MNDIALLISNLLIGLGLVFASIGLIALFRFNNFYPRVLASSKIDTVGTITILIGVVIRHGFSWFSAKALLLMFIIVLINPLVAHILTRYAYVAGHRIDGSNAIAKEEAN